MDHLALLLMPLYAFPISLVLSLSAPSDVPHLVIFRGHTLVWIQNEITFSFSICFFFVFRHITLRSLKAYWMNSCSDLMPSQTACTTLPPPKLVATGKTVLSTHPYQLTWTHRSNIRKILCFKHDKNLFSGKSVLFEPCDSVTGICRRTIARRDNDESSRCHCLWRYFTFSSPTAVIYFFPEPAQVVEPPLRILKSKWQDEFLSCQVHVWTCNTSVPATETPNRTQFVLRLHHGIR